MNDAELLLQWRNDDKVRRASNSMDVITKEQHLNWLSESLARSDRRLLVAELPDHRAVGTVRLDWDGRNWQVSWTVAPDARGAGIAKRMVRQSVSILNEPATAEVKAWNLASIKVAEAAGLREYRRDACKVYFSTPESGFAD